jgi:hypothetical protein
MLKVLDHVTVLIEEEEKNFWPRCGIPRSQ